MEVQEKQGTILSPTEAHGFTRRSFLKTSAAAAAVASLAFAGFGCSSSTGGSDGEAGAPAGDKVVLNCCRGSCTMHCPLESTVRDGKLVRTTAAKLSTIGRDDARICAKGSAWPNVVYAEKRIQYPYKRVGERGSGEWEQITWDEAIETISSKLTEIRNEFGGEAIATGYEGGILAPSGQGTYARWSGFVGATKLGCNDDQASIQLMGLYAGGSVDNENASNIIMIGASSPVSAPQQYGAILKAKERGAKLIIVNPNFETNASKADLYLPIRPGTDGALAMAAIKYIEENGLAADDYLNTLTVAPFLVKQTDGTFLRQSDLNGGEGAGTPEDAVLVWDSAADAAGSFMEVAAPALRGSFTAGDFEVSTAYQLLIERVADYSVDKAARLCDLSEEQVVAFAEACADNSAITAGMGPDHWGNGLGTFMAFLALKLQTGGLKQLEGYSSPTVYWPLTGFGLDEEGHPTEAPLELSPWMALPLAKEGKVELPGTTFERPLKALAFCMGGRATGWADHNRVIELFKTVDFFFAADINWGDNVQYADIVLPAASQFEVDDMENTMNYLVFCEKAIEPIYDSKPDFEIACLLAEGMGFGEDFKVKTIDDTLDITIRGNSSLSAMGLTIPDLRAAKYIEFTEPSTPPSFYTAFGRAVFYLENPRPGKDYGQTIDVERVRLPYFHAPTEAWTVSVDEFERNPLADQYPLTYLTGPRRFRTHGAFNMAANLRELDQEPSVYVNPQDAAERGIADGDTVKLFNDRGFVVARCVYHNGMRPGVVDMDRGWQTGQYKDNAGHFNSLTHVVMDPACYNHALYDVLCQMEKA